MDREGQSGRGINRPLRTPVQSQTASGKENCSQHDIRNSFVHQAVQVCRRRDFRILSRQTEDSTSRTEELPSFLYPATQPLLPTLQAGFHTVC